VRVGQGRAEVREDMQNLIVSAASDTGKCRGVRMSLRTPEGNKDGGRFCGIATKMTAEDLPSGWGRYFR